MSQKCIREQITELGSVHFDFSYKLSWIEKQYLRFKISCILRVMQNWFKWEQWSRGVTLNGKCLNEITLSSECLNNKLKTKFKPISLSRLKDVNYLHTTVNICRLVSRFQNSNKQMSLFDFRLGNLFENFTLFIMTHIQRTAFQSTYLIIPEDICSLNDRQKSFNRLWITMFINFILVFVLNTYPHFYQLLYKV